MLENFLAALLNLLTVLALIGGLFFMFAGGLGVARLPDFYSRNHAASKCATLGVTGMLLALVIYLGLGVTAPANADQEQVAEEVAAEVGTGEPVIAAATKAVLVVAFIFVATPVGAHMLARAAHLARVREWEGTLSDDLAVDRQDSEDLFPTYRGARRHGHDAEND